MTVDECYFLGRIIKAHGRNGECSILLDVSNPEEYKELESVFVELNKKPVPFFIEKIQLGHNNKAIVKFEGIDTAEEAANIAGSQLFLPLDVLPELKGKKFYFHEVIHFKALHINKTEIGIIQDVFELPSHPILQIIQNGKEILIPVTDETIVEVNRIEKNIILNPPLGLIEMYLSL
jgi:16S rRNA processing protein RimM